MRLFGSQRNPAARATFRVSVGMAARSSSRRVNQRAWGSCELGIANRELGKAGKTWIERRRLTTVCRASPGARPSSSSPSGRIFLARRRRAATADSPSAQGNSQSPPRKLARRGVRKPRPSSRTQAAPRWPVDRGAVLFPARHSADRGQPREHARDVRVGSGVARAEGEASHRRRCVIPETGKPAQEGGIARNPAVVLSQNQSCRAMEVAGASVIAETRPRGEHGVLPGAGQSRQIREPREKPFKSAADRGNRRLLEHDFRDPDAVRIAGPAPGEPPFLFAEPGQKLLTDELCSHASRRKLSVCHCLESLTRASNALLVILRSEATKNLLRSNRPILTRADPSLRSG